MNRTQVFKDLDELLNLDEGTVTGSEQLDALGWDSLATIGFMAMADERFGSTLQPQQIAASRTVEDLLALLGNRIAADQVL